MSQIELGPEDGDSPKEDKLQARSASIDFDHKQIEKSAAGPTKGAGRNLSPTATMELHGDVSNKAAMGTYDDGLKKPEVAQD